MQFTAEMIAGLLGGETIGDKSAAVSTVSSIEGGKEGGLAYLSNPKYEEYLYTTKCSVVLVERDFEPKQPVGATLIRVDNVGACVLRLLEMYNAMKPKKTGISPRASISEKATIGENCYVGDFAVIEAGAVVADGAKIYPQCYVGDGVRIGSDTTLYAGVKVYEGCAIGARCIIHAGAVIGADGFGFAPSPEGYEKIPQIGITILEDNVEIGANTCIDRATMGATVIRKGVKLDNLIQIAHNVEVGSHTVMASQVGVAGSTKIGEWCMFGGQVGVAGHITVGNRVNMGAQSGVNGSVKDGKQLIGTPPIEFKNYFKSSAVFKKLPDMYLELASLKKELEELKKQLNK